MSEDVKAFSPSAERNGALILDVLRAVVPASARDILEIGSGSGQHAACFAAGLTQVRWWPSDRDADGFASIEAWAAEASEHADIRPPRVLDVTWADWSAPLGGQRFDAMFNANMIHIAPFAVIPGLMRGAAQILHPGGRLILYGPFLRDGVKTADSNLAFDVWLRSRDAEWGIRRLEDVKTHAEKNGLRNTDVIEMPANNLVAVFEFSAH